MFKTFVSLLSGHASDTAILLQVREERLCERCRQLQAVKTNSLKVEIQYMSRHPAHMGPKSCQIS